MDHSSHDDPPSVAEFATAVSNIEFETIPDEVVETVEQCFKDTIAVALLGTTSQSFQIAFDSFADDRTGGDTAAIFGTSTRSSEMDAAFLNGLAAHALDYDDVSDAITGHPSATLVPAIVAASERVGATGPEMITAYVVGFETAAAIADPITPQHYERGWHPTATFGTFGSAAGTAAIYGLDPTGIRNALNVAASMAAGLKCNFGSMVKPMHVGQSVRSGLTAANLARNGFQAAADAITTEEGFLHLYGGDVDTANLQLRLPRSGETILQEGIDVKKYPCCYFAHAAIEVTRMLAREHGISGDDVFEVRATISRGARDALVHHSPETESEAKFSIEHAIAVAIQGEVGQSSFESSAVADPDITGLRDRIESEVDSSLPYSSYNTTVEITTTDGTQLSAVQELPPGKWGNPLSETERQEKFERCGTAVLTADELRHVDTLLAELASVDDVSVVTAYL